MRIILLLSVAFLAFIFVSHYAKAASIGDLISWFQSLFQAQGQTSTGQVFSTPSVICGQSGFTPTSDWKFVCNQNGQKGGCFNCYYQNSAQPSGSQCCDINTNPPEVCNGPTVGYYPCGQPAVTSGPTSISISAQPSNQQYCGQQVNFYVTVNFGQAGTYNLYMQVFGLQTGTAGGKIGLAQGFQQYAAGTTQQFYHFFAMWCENVRVHFSFEDQSGNVLAQQDVNMNTLSSTSCSTTGSALSLNPIKVSPSGSFTATATYDQNCIGKNVAIGLSGCGNGQLSVTGTLTGSNQFSKSLTAPSSEGTYTYYACVDPTGSGTYQQGGSATIQVGTGTGTGTGGVPTTCSNAYTSSYGNQLCMSTATCSWQGTDNVQVGQPDANGNLPVTFTSQYANGVNVFVVYGKIITVPSGSVPNYAGAVGSSKDICGPLTDTNNCNPDLIAHIVDNGKIFDYCTNKQNGYFFSTSTTPISTNSPARALMPLYLNSGNGGNGGTATITISPNCNVNNPCQQNPTGAITLYYQFYHDSGNNNNVQSWCNPSAGSGDKCSTTGCNGQYTGCTANGQIFTNSILCIHNDLTSTAASNGYACWHYPWEVYPNLWQTLNVAPQGGTGTCGAANQACCTSGTACGAGLTCQNNVCQTTVAPPPPPPPPPPVTSTTTATTPITTSTTTTTPTTTLPLIINCNTCIVNSQCQCSIDSSSCNNGFFTAQNVQGSPLSAQIGNFIPPYQISFNPNQTGSVNVTARCFDPFPGTRANSTTVPVLNQFLICPSSANVNIPTSCQVNNCNSGYIQAVENNALLAQSPFASSPFTLAFTATSVGTVNVTAFCQNPVIPFATATIPVVTGVSPPPITQPPATGTFTGVNFQCSPKIGTQITCSFTYTNKFTNALGQPQDVIVQFNFANNGVVEQNVQGSPVTAGPGTNIAQITFDCSLHNSGTYVVSWKAYADESRTNPIAWSTNSPNPLPEASC